MNYKFIQNKCCSSLFSVEFRQIDEICQTVNELEERIDSKLFFSNSWPMWRNLMGIVNH